MSSSRTQNLNRSRNLNINNCNSLKRLTAIAYTLCQAQLIMKKVEKFWRIRLQVTKDKVASRVLTYEPTEADIQNFADSMDNFFGEAIIEIFWKIS